MIDMRLQYVYVVTYQDGTDEPVISVFNNENAAVAYRDEEGKNHDRIWLDKAPIFSKTFVDGEWVGATLMRGEEHETD